MISSNDFRTGTSIELDGAVWRVVEFLHVKPGKGSAFVRTKLKAVQSGNVVEKTFRAGEMVPLFLSIGEKIKVDTRNDSYLGRENG